MKKRSLVLTATVIIVALISLIAFAACDGFGGDGDGGTNEFLFNENSTPQDVIDMVESGEIENYSYRLTQSKSTAYCYYSSNICFIEEYRTVNGSRKLVSSIYLIYDEQDELAYKIEDSTSSRSIYKYNSLEWEYWLERYFGRFLESYTLVSVGNGTMTWTSQGAFDCYLYDVNKTNIVLPSKYQDYKETAVVE
ncbi:MAG: hypothetical protein NC037_03110 [Bacteroides sp.]|nr:hypothetical protein [Bacillota bacterium]MCM1394050.1 hypothetical protein [[Eubacterium] siraeum]MCM1455502.1 hypothetical protein [Bacteroides sp.]